MPRDINQTQLLTNQALVLGGAPNTFGQNFPIGRGWYKTRIRIGITLTIGTGAGAITEGELLFIKNIFMKTDKNEILCNLNGRALYKYLQKINHTLSRKDNVAAASATYYVYLTIPHARRMDENRPLDTILDTARYKGITLQITVGTVSDLLTAPGTATITSAIDAEIVHTSEILPENAQPILYRSLVAISPVVPTVQQFIDIDRARDLAITAIMLATSNLAAAGVAFTGANSDAIIADFDVRDQDRFYQQTRLWEFHQSENKEEYSIEAQQVGSTIVDFAKDGSIFSSIYTGNKSMFRYQWRNKGGVIATDQVSLMYDGVRQLVA